MDDIKIDIDYDEFGKIQAERDRLHYLAKTYKEVIVELEADNKKLRKGFRELINSLHDLMQSSSGVSGLHLNGDFAPWEELVEGGRYEDWLLSISTAEDLLTELNVSKADD